MLMSMNLINNAVTSLEIKEKGHGIEKVPKDQVVKRGVLILINKKNNEKREIQISRQ